MTLKLNYRPIDTSRAQRLFWPNVEKKSKCWNWKGLKLHGYGIVWTGKVQVKAHRFSWVLHNGEISRGSCVLHKCDNKSCVNPRHLFLGNQDDNMKDMVKKKRQALHRGEQNGRAKLVESDVREIRKRLSKGHRGSDIAKDFNVNRVTIYSIRDRHLWGYLT